MRRLLIALVGVLGAAGAAHAASWQWSAPVTVNPQPLETLTSIACPTATLCVAVDAAGDLEVTTDPTGGAMSWRPPVPLAAHPLSSVACASVAVCVAAGGSEIITIAQPGSQPKFTAAAVDPGHKLVAVGCAPGGPCAAVDDAGNGLVSSDPADGAASWSAPAPAVTVGAAVTCPSATLCVAVGGHVAATVDPSKGSAWRSATADPDGLLTAVGCTSGASAPVCDAGDASGRLMASPAPAAGSWSAPQSTAVQTGDGFAAIACPSSSLCVATDTAGGVETWNAPQTPERWHLHRASPIFGSDPIGLVLPRGVAVSCASSSLCGILASGECHGSCDGSYNYFDVLVDPAGSDRGATGGEPYAGSTLNSVSCAAPTACMEAGEFVIGGSYVVAAANAQQAATATAHVVSRTAIVGAVACPSTSLCVAADDHGDALSAAQPFGPGARWHTRRIDHGVGSGQAVSCPTARFCAATFGTGAVYTSTTPGGAWRAARLPRGINAELVSCASPLLCALSDGERVWVSTTPGGRRPRWRRSSPRDRQGITGLSCPSARLCVAVGGDGGTFGTSDPASPHARWHGGELPVVPSAVQCANARLCLALAGTDSVYVSTAPAAVHPRWSAVQLPPGVVPPATAACTRDGFCAVTSGGGAVTFGGMR